MFTAREDGVSVMRLAPDADDSAWRHVVDEVSQSTLAHAPEWLAAIGTAYGHEPLYLTAEDDEGRRGVLPAFIVRRPFFGTVVTSMPFLDTGGPCGSSASLARALVERLIGEGRSIGAQLVELRSTQRLDVPSPPMEHKVNLSLCLPADPDRLWRQLDASVRNKVRKAERAGLSVEFGAADKLTAFYDIFAARMRDLGSPVHSIGFLRAVLKSFGDRARIALVRKGSMPIGGLVAVAFKDRLVVPWATCLKDYFSLGPNNLLYWETIRAACLAGVGHFDFGRSSRNSGTYDFKRQWGAQEEPLFWYTIPIGRHRAQARPDAGRGAAFLVGSWRHLPLAVTRRVGPGIRKYLTQ